MAENDEEKKKSSQDSDTSTTSTSTSTSSTSTSTSSTSKNVTLATRFPTDEFVVTGIATITSEGTEVSPSEAEKVYAAASERGIRIEEVKK